ncbi:MAG: preprotein translocase subunit YajC [Verrucomicrobiae bacterium]|nr:preprotein translocase subunit YajC [Verrucomicrobiae bacterium]
MASTPPGTESTAPGWTSFFPFLIMFALLYLVLIRPQQTQQKKMQQLISSLKAGDQVLLSGGIYGSVVEAKEKTLLVKIADNVKIKVLRSAVTQLANSDSGSSAAPKETRVEKEIKAGVTVKS